MGRSAGRNMCFCRQGNWKRPAWNERDYIWKKGERARCLAEGAALLLIICYEFYHSLWLACLFSPLLFWYLKYKKKKLYIRRQELMKIQFRDGILSLAGAVGAGLSLENGMKEAKKELGQIWGTQSLFYQEMEQMERQMALGKSAEYVWAAFGDRSGSREIQDFSQIFGLLKRTGGDLAGTLRDTAEQIGERIRTEQEIQAVLASKKLEQKIMNGIPLGILLYLNLGAGELLAPMYEGILGRSVMTVCLGIYLAAYFWGQKLTEIRV